LIPSNLKSDLTSERATRDWKEEEEVFLNQTKKRIMII